MLTMKVLYKGITRILHNWNKKNEKSILILY